MEIKLPVTIQNYVDASNQNDVKSVVACFSNDAFVRDEGQEYRGKENIKHWIEKTIENYKFHFKPLIFKEGKDNQVVVGMEVSGTFDGSPLRLDFHFKIVNDQISRLSVEQ